MSDLPTQMDDELDVESGSPQAQVNGSFQRPVMKLLIGVKKAAATKDDERETAEENKPLPKRSGSRRAYTTAGTCAMVTDEPVETMALANAVVHPAYSLRPDENALLHSASPRPSCEIEQIAPCPKPACAAAVTIEPPAAPERSLEVSKQEAIPSPIINDPRFIERRFSRRTSVNRDAVRYIEEITSQHRAIDPDAFRAQSLLIESEPRLISDERMKNETRPASIYESQLSRSLRLSGITRAIECQQQKQTQQKNKARQPFINLPSPAAASIETPARVRIDAPLAVQFQTTQSEIDAVSDDTVKIDDTLTIEDTLRMPASAPPHPVEAKESAIRTRLLKESELCQHDSHQTVEPLADEVCNTATVPRLVTTEDHAPIVPAVVAESKAARSASTYTFATMAGLGAAVASLLVNATLSRTNCLTWSPVECILLLLSLITTVTIQIVFSTASRQRERIQRLRDASMLSEADEQAYLQVQRQESKIRRLVGAPAMCAVIGVWILIKSIQSDNFGNLIEEAVMFISAAAITAGWVMGARCNPPKAMHYSFFASLITFGLTSAMTGTLDVVRLIGDITTAVCIGETIDASGSQRIGLRTCLKLFVIRSITYLFAIEFTIWHQQQCGTFDSLSAQTAMAGAIIVSIGWTLGLVSAATLSEVDQTAEPVDSTVQEPKTVDPRAKNQALCLLADAQKWIAGGDMTRAEAALKQAISLDQYDANLYCEYGLLLNKEHRFKEASDMFTAATKLSPRHARSWLRLAALHFNHKRYRDARNACISALKCDLTQEEQGLLEQCLVESERKIQKGFN